MLRVVFLQPSSVHHARKHSKTFQKILKYCANDHQQMLLPFAKFGGKITNPNIWFLLCVADRDPVSFSPSDMTLQLNLVPLVSFAPMHLISVSLQSS